MICGPVGRWDAPGSLFRFMPPTATHVPDLLLRSCSSMAGSMADTPRSLCRLAQGDEN